MSKKFPFIKCGVFLTLAAAFLCRSAISAQAAESDVQMVSQPLRMAPYVSISVIVKAGAINETKSNAGWRQLLATAMVRGTILGDSSLDAVALHKAAEAAGGEIGVQVLEDAMVFTAAGDSAKQKDLAELLLNVVLHPRLSHEDLAAARRATLRQLGANATNAIFDNSAATEKLQSMLYRNASGVTAYGLPAHGTVDSLSGFTDDRAREYHKFYFTSPNIVVSCSGDVDEAALRAIFSRIPKGIAPPVSPLNYTTPDALAMMKMPVDAPWNLTGYRIDPHVSGKELAALRVLTAALVNTSPSILSKVLLMPHDDKDHSLASSVSAQFIARQYGSELIIAVQSDSQHLTETRNMIYTAVNKAIAGIKANSLTPDQLKTAIAYTEGDWAVSNDSNVSRGVLLGYAAAQQIPVTDWPELFKAVTAQDIKNVATKYLDKPSLVVVLPDSSASQ